jgi:hypothetical protein
MQFINSAATTKRNLPFSQAVRVGDVLYLSGALGNLPGTLTLTPGGMEGQGRRARPWRYRRRAEGEVMASLCAVALPLTFRLRAPPPSK